MPEYPSPSAAQSSAPPPALVSFRFSLLSLLSVTTLAGFTSAVVFSQGWDPLERLLLAFWGAGLILGASAGRARGKHGIFSGGLGASLGCALATLVCYDENFAIVSIFVIVTGWLLAVAMATVYDALLSGAIETWWARRLIRRAVYAICGLMVLCLIGSQAANRPVWKPAWEQRIGVPSNFSVLPKIILSPIGDRLLENESSSLSFSGATELNTGRTHALTPRGLVEVPFSLPWGFEAAFSPDGTRIALGRGPRLELYDVRTGRRLWERRLDLNPLEVVLHHRFSRDGQRIYVTTHTPRIQRLRVLDVDGGAGAGLELFPFAGQLFVSDGGDKLVKFLDPTEENSGRAIEIVDLIHAQTIGRFDDIPGIEKPIFNLAGDRLALGSQIWKLPHSQPQSAGGRVIGLLTNRRALVLDREAPPNYVHNLLPSWLQQMPFVRHLRTADRTSQLRICNEAGQTLRATPWLADLHQVELSANQRIAVSASREGLIRVWKVPE